MKKRLVAALAVLGLVAAGGVAAIIVSSPGVSLAQDTTDEAPGEEGDVRPDFSDWASDALAPLVSDGVITEAQADAVIEALEDAKPEHRHRGGFRGAIGGFDELAGLLGFEDPAELREALADGQTIAEVAEANGVAVQVVIDTLVAEHTEKLMTAVEDGRLTQEEADEHLADVTERITDLVNGEIEFGGRGLGRGPSRGPGGLRGFESPPASSGISF